MAAHPATGQTGKDLAAGMIITSLMLAGAILLGSMGFAISLLVPLPVFYYRAKSGRLNGGLILCGCAILLFWAPNLKAGGGHLLFLAGMMLLGFMLHEMLELNLPLEHTVGLSVGAVAALWLAVILLFWDAAQSSYASAISQAGRQMGLLLDQLVQSGQFTQQQADQAREQMPMIVRLGSVIAMGSAVVWTMFAAWINLLAARIIYARLGLPYPDFGRLSHWRAPERLVWVVIGCLIAINLAGGWVKDAFLIAGVVTAAIYMLGGIAIAAFYLDKHQVPRVQRVMILTVAMLVFGPLLFLILLVLGFFDLWADFRRLHKKSLTTEDQQ